MIYLTNTTYIDYQTLEFKTCHIKVNEGVDGTIELLDQIPVHAEAGPEIIDCSGKYVTKSFACGHHHIYSALALGMPAPKKTPANFYEILEHVWWTLDKCLDKDMIEASALVTAIASIKAGCTFVIDHHSSPNYIGGSLDTISKSLDKSGISHLLCYEITDRNGEDKTEKALIETEQYLQKNQGLVGLHASFTVGKETMQFATDLVNKYISGVHIHVAEDLFDQIITLREFKKRVIYRLKDYNLLNSSKTILGHCLHLDENERDILRNSKAYIVQNTESNLNNKVGSFNSEWLGDRIMLGTDGMHSDMLRSAKSSFFVGQANDKIDYKICYQRFRKVHDYIKLNNFKGDGPNNLVVIDYPAPTDFNSNNFPGHFIFGLESEHIQHVISNGKLIMRDRKILTLNEKEILDFSKEQSKRLWEKLKK